MRRSVQSKQVVCGRRPALCERWISSKIWLNMLNWQHLLDGMIPKHHQALFSTPAFPAQGLSAMLVSPGKGSCRHHRFARALARCHCKQRVPGRLIGLGVRSFRLEILQPLRDLMLKPAGPWMDPYFHLSIHCILIVFYCGGRGDRTAAKYFLERSGPSGHFQRHENPIFVMNCEI